MKTEFGWHVMKRVPPPPPDKLESGDILKRAPVTQTAARVQEVPPGALHAVVLGDHPVLLANVEGEVFAIANRCADSPLPLQFGTLREHVITCSWHGCQYDVRTGHRVDGPGPGVAVFPVRVSGDDIQVVIAVTPVGRAS